MKVVVIGGGASGIFCSGLVASFGHDCILLEKNERIGKKMYITGKGRCNVTNCCEVNEFLENVVTNRKFLMSSIYKFSPYDTMDFLSRFGLDIKVERGNRVFPTSDKANDVINTFENFARKNNVDIRLNTKVLDIVAQDNAVKSVITNKGKIECDAVVVATGGKSYSTTGSTGDGYEWARKLGHNIIMPKPALSAIKTSGVDGLAGLSLKNVSVSIYENSKVIESDFGEMLFTHTGVSGPIILSLSSKINKFYQNGNFTKKLLLCIDLKPALDINTLDNRILREFGDNINCEIKNILPSLMPKSLIPIVLEQAKIRQNTVANSITKEQRKNLVDVIKCIKFNIIDLEKLDFAIVTSGGVDVKQVDPKDMQSKLVSGLYFVGEVLDVDALTGGYNLQIAFSTAYAMASSIK